MDLPQYKTLVLDTVDILANTAAPWCGPESPLPPDIAKSLANRMGKAKMVCHERMANFHPRVMLYGVYNSGKSTLLNALLGEERAAMADVPKTAQSTSYDWNGHELVDTPGIDAPIEHEEISRETLRTSQIVLFVVSSKGSFENNKIYEAMRDVVEQGKKLIIVLNNKDDEHDEEGLRHIKERIQKILEANGFTRQQAASFRLVLVNAKYGMQGRLRGKSKLVEYSGIKNLEEVIYDEIRRTNGYAIVKDSLNYLLADFNHLLTRLQDYSKRSDTRQVEDYYALREQYDNFLAGLVNFVDTDCASLTEEIRHCFPAPGADFASEDIQGRVNQLLDDCLRSINSKIAQDCEKFRNILTRQGLKILQASENTVQMEAELGNYEDLIAALKGHQEEASRGSGPSYNNDSDLLEKVGNAAWVLSELPITKLPIPLPIPPMVISLILKGIKVVASLFGKSAAEKQNERMEAQIAYEREMAEKQARMQERQREEIKSYAEDIKSKFVKGVKIDIRNNIPKQFKPVLDALEAQCAANSRVSENLRTDISRLMDKISQLNLTISELA